MNIFDYLITLGKEKFETSPLKFLEEKERSDELPPYKVESVQDLINWYSPTYGNMCVSYSHKLLHSNLLDMEYNKKVAMEKRFITQEEFDKLIVNYTNYLINYVYKDIDFEKINHDLYSYYNELANSYEFIHREEVKRYIEKYGKGHKERANNMKLEFHNFCANAAKEYVNNAYSLKDYDFIEALKNFGSFYKRKEI